MNKVLIKFFWVWFKKLIFFASCFKKYYVNAIILQIAKTLNSLVKMFLKQSLLKQ